MTAVAYEPITSFEGEWHFLSNFHHTPVMYRNVLYPTVEHAFQAAKTLDLASREAIRQTKTPGEAKRLGRSVRLRPGWDVIKRAIMRHLIVEKFTTYPTMKKALLSTGDVPLSEGNAWGDTYWGVYRGVGENHLGHLLMEVRAMLQAERRSTCSLCGAPKPVGQSCHCFDNHCQ